MALDALNGTAMHTVSTFLVGKVATNSLCRKQGMNTRSSTKVEVVAADKIVSPMMWTQLFLKAQGYEVKENILYQDSKSTILLETNGHKSASKCSHHLNIQYFYVIKRPKATLTLNIV